MKLAKFIPALSILFIFFAAIFIFPTQVKGQNINCSNRFVTFVNPVRGRNLWIDGSINPLNNQYQALAKYNYSATWLLQYDALMDAEITNDIKTFGIKGEEGLFLEVSRKMADEAGVAYPDGVRWSDPGAVFLSAYSQSERRLLIDKIYSKYKEIFGYYPRSVGAWWIDSYSLNYIKGRYGLDAVMIVADQKTTDSYGVWGQWWGLPYRPSDRNVLVPGKMDSVVIQWAQRDPVLAYGAGPLISNFSVQANDYIRSGKDTNYFINLVGKYLDCENKVGQVTIGLETGMEGAGFHSEYLNQLRILNQIETLKAVTMSEFASSYKSAYAENPSLVRVSDWILTPSHRQNLILGDWVNYVDVPFSDYFVPDRSGFLNRNLNNLTAVNISNSFSVGIVSLSILITAFLLKQKRGVVIWSILFGIVSYGLVFRSQIEYGWEVFYGPVFTHLIQFQVVMIFYILTVSLTLNKLNFSKLFLWLIPLSFGIDWILGFIRYTNIAGSKYLGLAVSHTNFIGIKFGETYGIVISKFNPTFLGAFLKIPFERITNDLFLYVFLYPGIHIVLAFLVYLLIKKLPPTIRVAVIIIFIILFILQVFAVLTADPRTVFAVE